MRSLATVHSTRTLLFMLLAACGDEGGGGTGVDAGSTGDTTQDAAIPPADASGIVTFEGRSGTRVYFQSTDSTLIAMVDTDAMGHASATVPEGGSVTAVFTDDSATRVYSYLHVHPGDVLRATYDYEAERVNFTVTFPVDPTAGVVGYRLESPCYIFYNVPVVTNTPTLTTGGVIGCYDTTTELVVRSVDSYGRTINTLYAENLPVGSPSTFNLMSSAWTPVLVRSVQVTGLPLAATRLGLSVLSPHGVVEYPPTVNNPSTATYTAVTFPGAIDHYRALSTSGDSIKAHVAWGPSAATFSLDASGQMPWVTSGMFDAATTSVAWTENSEGTTATPNVATAILEIDRAATGRSWVWHVIAPYDGPSLALPNLPTEASEYMLQAGDAVQLRNIRIARAARGHQDIAANPFYTYRDREQLAQPGQIDIAGWSKP